MATATLIGHARLLGRECSVTRREHQWSPVPASVNDQKHASVSQTAVDPVIFRRV